MRDTPYNSKQLSNEDKAAMEEQRIWHLVDYVYNLGKRKLQIEERIMKNRDRIDIFEDKRDFDSAEKIKEINFQLARELEEQDTRLFNIIRNGR